MHDVRFYVDSVFTRICKFVDMGVMVSFVGLTALYDAILSGGNTRSFQGIAILMFAARIFWVLKYGVVLYFVRVFDKTLIPLLLTMFIYLASAFGFLATWLQTRTPGQFSTSILTGAQGQIYVRTWYIIICLEAVLVIGVSMIWRILSFKHTHLVERVGLLSLIIMGEGIIGLVKSTSYAIQGTSVTLLSETGIVAAGVLLIYLIYILYFDNIDHHRFGTIRQQIWTLLHFPAHVSILLTVEGSTALLIWNACRSAIAWITEDSLPSVSNPQKLANGTTFANQADWLAQLNRTYEETQTRYYYKYLTDYYKTFPADLEKLGKPKAAYGTDAWTKEVGPTIQKMKDYYEYFVYQNFAAEGPYYSLKKEEDYGKRVQLYEDGFKFTMIYYYIAAGTLLVILAFLYWFGRTKLTRTEWYSVGIRLFAGLCLPVMIVSPLLEKADPTDSSFRFEFSYLLIPIVTLGYLLVIIVDNIVKAISEKHYTIVEERRLSRMTSYETKTVASEEERELTDEDSSYEMHRGSPRQGDIEHGAPQMIPSEADHASLIQNAQRSASVRFSDMKAAASGYGPVGQQDDDVTEYRRGDDSQHFRQY